VPAGGTSAAGRSAVVGQARSVVVLPPPAGLAAGDSFALVALVRGQRGTPLPGRAVEWNTDSPEVLHLDRARNVATAVAPGSAVLIASCEGIETRVQVRVPPTTLELFAVPSEETAAAIQMSTPPKAVRAGDSFVLTATPLDRAGVPLLDQTVLWSSSDVRVAVVTAEGWVAALGRGQVTLTATRGGASASVSINVEHAIPARKPTAVPRRHQVEPLPSAGGDPDHRSSWRRRGARSRRALGRVILGLGAVAAALWFFGGLRDFRWDRDLPWLYARDPAVIAADTTPRAEPAESVASVDRGAAAVAAPRRPRRSVPARPAPAESLAGAVPDTGAAALDSAAAGAIDRPELAEIAPSDPSAYAPPQDDPEGGTPAEESAASHPAEPRAEPTLGGRTPLARAGPVAPIDRRQLESRMRDGVSDCYGAVRSKDLDRLAEMYRPRNYADDDKLKRLTTILRTEPWRAVVGKRVDGVREMSADAAAAEFSFRLVWRGTHGGQLSSQPIFRAEFARGSSGWRMSSCRIVGSPKL
jgi:hypothetical protein